MKRKIYQKLLDWKNDSNYKPMVLIGARQVGKTYIVEEFCKNEFSSYVTVNLFERKDIIELYKSNMSSDEKFLKLKAYINLDIEKENTCLFIDEIQESEELISELKYFCEKHQNVKIICSGSLLGIKFKRFSKAFPVGKIKMLMLYPMDFEEYLMAFDEEYLIAEIKECYNNNRKMLDSLHEKALNYYRLYLCSGGMPESVMEMLKAQGDVTKYDRLPLSNIVDAYFKDMTKYVTSSIETLKINRIYDSIPSQLLGSSNKFQYSKIDNNARSRDYELALDWLEANNMVLKSFLVTNPQVPLKGFVNYDYFKIFYNDVGILCSKLEISPNDIITDNISLYKGVLAESFVAAEFVNNNISLYYWESSGIAEVDFLIYNSDGIIPVEVKSGENTKSKSLTEYMKKYNPKYAIRVSTKNFGFVNNIKSVPLYAVFCIK